MQENVSLKPYTSLFIGGNARYFFIAKSVQDIVYAINFSKNNKIPYFILGGGSNILVSDDGFPGIVIKIEIIGVKEINDNKETKIFEVGAGESWDNFVKFIVESELYGIENLSHIPGTVGASVVQNIGAYGQEVSTCVLSVDVLDTETLKEISIDKSNLNFSYRKSILNSTDRGRYIVLSVKFNVQRNGNLNLSYDDLTKYFKFHSDTKPSLQNVRNAIISIRNSKFPFPDSPTNGTAGSFFNAEVVDLATYENIIYKLRQRGFYEKAEDMEKKKSVFSVKQGFKVPYGVLAEVLGFKGKSYGGAKILETHAGVINNFTGEARAEEVFKLSQEIILKVYDEFGVKIKIEPELVGKF